MKIVLSRDKLLKPLQFVSGVVERRQTLPILSNVLLTIKANVLSLIGTDSEVELISRIPLDQAHDDTAITIPARKLMDICRNLPEQAELTLQDQGDKLLIVSGRSRFSLATLPADEFPTVNTVTNPTEFTIAADRLKSLLEQTHFAIAQQDVRYFLNGSLWQVENNFLHVVATDGHRLALASEGLTQVGDASVIVPRKAIVEMLRLLMEVNDQLTIQFDNNHICISTREFTLTSKLIDGRYPDYRKVIPKKGNKIISLDRDELKTALSRVSILSNEKHRGVRFELRPNLLRLSSHNPEQDHAEEEIALDYTGDELDIGFNISYLLDVLNVLSIGEVQLILGDANSSLLIEQATKYDNCTYVIMPMRL